MKSLGFIGAVSRFLSGVGGLTLVVMTLWTVVDVITRYLLSKPLQGSIDLVESTLVLVVFLALPECFRRDEQVTVDLVDHFISARSVQWLMLLSTFATTLFLVLLIYTGIQPFLDAWQSNPPWRVPLLPRRLPIVPLFRRYLP